ncbi:patellin-4-like [Telopea speciosissima]|uniref:patellin-4-like n=1 Tax=Telopea speciosissima TaxID=54955 RepID=UPI001CC5AE96|nr:patellin-4-like [Telopea speciosissima]
MTAEVKANETQVEEIPVSQPAETTKDVEETSPADVAASVETGKVAEGAVGDEPKTAEVEEKNIEAEAQAGAGDAVVVVSKSSSFKEESYFLSDLKEYEKKALIELRSKLEEAILANNLFNKEEAKKEETKEEDKPVEETKEEKPAEEEAKKEEKKEEEKPAEEEEKKEEKKEEEKPAEEEAKKEEKKEEEKPAEEEEKEDAKKEEEKKEDKTAEESQKKENAVHAEEKPAQEEAIEKEKSATEGEADNEKPLQEAEVEKKHDVGTEEKAVEVDTDISLWGIPLLSSKGAEGTDVILLKFMRARDFKVNDAFEMLKNTLQWRKELNIDSILEEDLDSDLNSVAYMNGVDHEGHPVCYNIYGVFQNEELYQKTFGTEEKRNQFLRWRFQLMEKGIQKLHFKPGGVSSLLQINDLKNSPGPSKRELRIATKQAVGLLQDNYPEFVARNIFINVPFWYYAFNALLSPFLTQRTKSKFVFARPSKVSETLLKYIPAENIPIQYGGLKRENDSEFFEDGSVSELNVKSGGKETVEIPVPEVGTTALWDLTVLGWEVTYKEEFVPDDEGSYTVIIQKPKKISANEEPVRNYFRNNEPGKIVLTIENASYKKKRVLFRFKTK